MGWMVYSTGYFVKYGSQRKFCFCEKYFRLYELKLNDIYLSRQYFSHFLGFDKGEHIC